MLLPVQFQCPACHWSGSFDKLKIASVVVLENEQAEDLSFCPSCNAHLATIRHNRLYLIKPAGLHPQLVSGQPGEEFVGYVIYDNGCYYLTNKHKGEIQ